jgi:hypothetical protein
MSRAELTWFRLSFPRDLDQKAVVQALASFSGAPHRTRLIFDLEATHAGITHRLAVSGSHADIVIGGLRAAMPSLRLEPIKAPAEVQSRRLLWQLQPHTAVIRADELGGISASLLAGLFPLGKSESLRLVWQVRPHMRPILKQPQKPSQKAAARARAAKLALPGLGALGELRVVAASPARARQLAHRAGTTLWGLSTPHGRLMADSYWWGQIARICGRRGRYFSVPELAAVIGWPVDNPEVPGLELGAAKRLVPSKALPTTGRVLGISDFAGHDRPVAISAQASTRGLYVLGPTGTGKTSLIKNLVRADLEQGAGLAVVETNGDLIADLLDLIPPHRRDDVVLLDPTDRRYAVGFNPFAASPDPSLAADQLVELFQRLWKDFWGPRTGQLAHMGLLTLARREGSTLLDLPRLFLDDNFRAEVLADLDDPVGLEPDWRWFSALGAREQATVVAPLLNKVRAFTSRPSVRAIVGQPNPPISMRQILAERKILLVQLPKGLIGSETATLLGCLILTGLWQATAERVGQPQATRTPFGLYVDEVQDFAAAPIPWGEMFSQGRKYGLALTVAHQNLEQLPRELREVVLANARSKAAFTLSASDAKTMERLFAPDLAAADLAALDAYSIAATVALDDGSTARPVTLKTLPPPEPLGSAAAVKQASQARYASKQTDVEAALRRNAAGGQAASARPVGRKRRQTP